MYTLLIGLIISIPILIFGFHRVNRIPDTGVKNTAIIIILTGLLVCVPLIPYAIAVALAVNPPTITETQETKVDIVATRGNTLTHGSITGGIFIISGYIQESPVYFFYKKVGDGYIQAHIQAQDATIYEDTKNGTGHIIIKNKTTILEPNWERQHLHWVLLQRPKKTSVEAEIHLPPNSIIKEFVLDAE